MNYKEEQLMNELVRLFHLQERISYAFDLELDEYVDISEIHCITCVGYKQEANGIQIANELKMTRGAISKITHRLIKKGYLCSYQKTNNRKEVYFSLTDLGETIYAQSMKSHQKWREKNMTYLHTISLENQKIVYNFLKSFNEYLLKQVENSENGK